MCVKIDYESSDLYSDLMNTADMSNNAFDAWLVRVRARLRSARESAGLSYREAGEKTGVHFANVRRAENPGPVPSLDVIYRLAAGYGVSLESIVCGGKVDTRDVPDTSAIPNWAADFAAGVTAYRHHDDENQSERFTIADVASAVGISPEHLSAIERGETPPDAKTAILIAAALDVPPTEMFTDSGFQERLKAIREAKQDQVAAIKKAARKKK